jgi:hypothetical protein
LDYRNVVHCQVANNIPGGDLYTANEQNNASNKVVLSFTEKGEK